MASAAVSPSRGLRSVSASASATAATVNPRGRQRRRPAARRRWSWVGRMGGVRGWPARPSGGVRYRPPCSASPQAASAPFRFSRLSFPISISLLHCKRGAGQ
jgi:hypothetical protein